MELAYNTCVCVCVRDCNSDKDSASSSIHKIGFLDFTDIDHKGCPLIVFLRLQFIPCKRMYTRSWLP